MSRYLVLGLVLALSACKKAEPPASPTPPSASTHGNRENPPASTSPPAVPSGPSVSETAANLDPSVLAMISFMGVPPYPGSTTDPLQPSQSNEVEGRRDPALNGVTEVFLTSADSFDKVADFYRNMGEYRSSGIAATVSRMNPDGGSLTIKIYKTDSGGTGITINHILANASPQTGSN